MAIQEYFLIKKLLLITVLQNGKELELYEVYLLLRHREEMS